MSKKSNVIFLEISNRTSYNIENNYFFRLFQNLNRKNLLSHKISSLVIDKSVVNLAIVNDEEIKSINKKYRNKDKVTDVLSFEFFAKNEFILPENKNYLGEIFISYPEAKRKAKEFNISYFEEFVHLFMHGFLHVWGYDHEKNEEEEKLMFKLEENLVKKISEIKKADS